MSGQDYLLSLLVRRSEPHFTELNQIRQKPSPFLKYHYDNLTVKYIGQGISPNDIGIIQSKKPISLDNFIYYFEVKINYVGQHCDLSIGLAEDDFPENKHPGLAKRSFGYRSDGSVLYSKKLSNMQMPAITERCYIGCGFNLFRNEIFYTYNGKYFGPAFREVEIQEYYPTVSLHSPQECVTFNFGDKPYKFNIDEMILGEKKVLLEQVMDQNVDYFSMHQIIHSYLNFCGYTETLKAFEKIGKLEGKEIGLLKKDIYYHKEEEEEKKNDTLKITIKELFESEKDKVDEEDIAKSNNTKEQTRESSKSNGNNHLNLESNPDSPTDIPRQEERSDLRYAIKEDLHLNHQFLVERKNSQPLNQKIPLNKNLSNYSEENNSQNIVKQIQMEEDHHIDPKTVENFENLNETVPRYSKYFLDERNCVRSFILEGKIEETLTYINEKFPNLFEKEPEAKKALYVQLFIEHIKNHDTQKALECIQNHLTEYKNSKVYCIKDHDSLPTQVSIDDVLTLMCYFEPETSNLKHYLTKEQREVTGDIVNKSILSHFGYLDRSILEVMIAQLTQIHDRFQQLGVSYGESFEFKV